MTRDELIDQIKIECFNQLLTFRDDGDLCAQSIEEVVMHYISVYDTTHEICDKLGVKQ